MKKDKSGLIIGVLVGIIIMLVVLVVLFVTNVISFSKVEDNSTNKENDAREIVGNDKKDDTVLDSEKYSAIIDEYKRALNDSDFNNNMDTEKTYPNINDYIIHLYYTSRDSVIKYSFYDVNKDGKNEMIVGNKEGNIFEMYTYDGSKANRFYNQSCLGYRCSSSIYENGIVYFYGSGGANLHGLEFYKIGSNGYDKEIYKSYEVVYDGSGNATITDKVMNTKTNYTKDEEVISSVVGNSSKVDLSRLDWKEF